MKTQVIKHIKKYKIVAICRQTYGDDLLRLAQALAEGGIGLLEITFDQADPQGIKKTADAVRLVSEKFGKDLLLGTGTVLTREQVVAAYQAGAKYVIMPNVNPDIIRMAGSMGMATIPGSMTATEILRAYSVGADFVKLFPAGTLGIAYAKDLFGPINHIPMIATAGVTPVNLGQFLELGYKGAGISSYLTDKKKIAAGDFATLTQHAKELMEIANRY